MEPRTSADDLFMASDADEMRAIAVNLWTIELRAGDAYGLGGPEADPNALADDLGGELLTPAKGEQRVAIYRVPDGRAVLVGATHDGLWGVDVLPRSTMDEFIRPGGTLRDDQEYEDLQIAAELSAASNRGIGDEWEKVLAGAESEDAGSGTNWGWPRVADPMEDAEPPLAAADTLRELMGEIADTEREYADVLHPDSVDPEVERRVMEHLERQPEPDEVDEAKPAAGERQDRRP